MSLKDEQKIRAGLIEQVNALVDEKVAKPKATLIQKFIHQYYGTVSLEDLQSRSILDLYGAALSLWQYVKIRKSSQAKVRIYNPQLEQQGWQSTHTIVEISCEDKPFFIDSIRMAFSELELKIHLMLYMSGMEFIRSVKGEITAIGVCRKTKKTTDSSEILLHMEIDHQSDSDSLLKIKKTILLLLNDLDLVLNDFQAMKEKMREIIQESKTLHDSRKDENTQESIDLLEWLVKDHFTFLGYQQYRLIGNKTTTEFTPEKGRALGVLSEKNRENQNRKLYTLPEKGKQLVFSKSLLILTKTNTISKIHRPDYTSSVEIKIFDQADNLIGVHRFIGLYTAELYNRSTRFIPIIRKKIESVITYAEVLHKPHVYKALLNILENYPREELFYASAEELADISLGILQLEERHKIKFFLRSDPFGRYFSCLVYVPREQYDSALRKKMQNIIAEKLKAEKIIFSVQFAESGLARVHFMVRVGEGGCPQVNVTQLELELIDAARTWNDDLNSCLIEQFGEEKGNLALTLYSNAFPASYKETFPARVAVSDIGYLESLSNENSIGMSLYCALEDLETQLRFKLFRKGQSIPLSHVVPMLENMGLKILSERPYKILRSDEMIIWINEYRLELSKNNIIKVEEVKKNFQEAFLAIWLGLIENDGFNKLILEAKLNWKQVNVLRALYKFLWQIGMIFSQPYVESTLYHNPEIAFELFRLFEMRFQPKKKLEQNHINAQVDKIQSLLQSVESLNEDRIIRRYLNIVCAMVRTNYFLETVDETGKPYIAFKFNSHELEEIAKPIPFREIFVYSPIMEGIHLRGGQVARGGIRWSDRRDDFRKEILGLMKSQQVKNALIVPVGAKGGFVIKINMDPLSTEDKSQLVASCYQILIKGLLDMTDNYRNQTPNSDQKIVIYDKFDPYLVVAADKGTAHFSDIANEISIERQFWLQDAFASGGSSGYDHKKMGITARGAFESVKQHFLEQGKDIDSLPFTAIGVGDMSGDVFGNGMLLSKNLKLIAAFDHRDIFIDPYPDLKLSFQERQRLFLMARSSWQDYNPQLLSKGGGIFSRDKKIIQITPEMKVCFQIKKSMLTPNELIQALLKSSVELVLFGGIGTFIKGSSENNLSVGDRTNDSIRVNAEDMNAKVIVEGGNLACTQLARIEFAKGGGKINADFIDNAAGVSCSDREVNIKILLNDLVEQGDLTWKQRDLLLKEMTEEVATLVLENNIKQIETISIAEHFAPNNLKLHQRLIVYLERKGHLDRVLEFLPDTEQFDERKINQTGLTRPEIAILFSYVKNLLQVEILKLDISKNNYMNFFLINYFPVKMQKKFKKNILVHPLKKEIIATQLSNCIVNEMGFVFVYRLIEETGADLEQIIKVYVVAREIFQVDYFQEKIRILKGKVEYTILITLLKELIRVVRRGSRWLLKNSSGQYKIQKLIEKYKMSVSEISGNLSALLTKEGLAVYQSKINAFVENQVPEKLAHEFVAMEPLYSALDIIEAAHSHNLPVQQVACLYFTLGDKLDFSWFRSQIKQQPIENHWQALARGSLRDDLDRQQRLLTMAIIRSQTKPDLNIESLVENWLAKNPILVDRWQYFMTELKSTVNPEFTMFSIALRELTDLTHALLNTSHLCVNTSYPLKKP